MTPEQDRAIDKIKKLLRLGRGTNHDGERDAALAKAAEIAASVGLDISGIDAGESERKITQEKIFFARRSHARLCVHGILRHHFGVFVVGGCGTLIYFGPGVNIEIAKHIEIYLIREASAEWARYRDENSLRKRGLGERRKLWERGFFHAISSALDARPLRNDAEALRQEVERYANRVCKINSIPYKFPRARNIEDFFAGGNSGDSINLSRPVNGADTKKMLVTS